MAAPEAVFLSYRLGGQDGVAVESAKWEGALHEHGFTTRRVTGAIEGPRRDDDIALPFLAIEPAPDVSVDRPALVGAIAGADLVVVENLCSLPLNLDAATMARSVLDEHRGRVVFHHHDFAWERPHLAHVIGFPPDRPESLHVTISEHARIELRRRGIDARHIPNSFDFDAFDGDRDRARATEGFAHDVIVLMQPTRAIPRKNVAGGIAFASELAAFVPSRPVHYWITGPAEDGFDGELARLLANAPVPVHVGRAQRSADAYAAADLVVFPSTWEGFGNPVVESVAARRMVVTADYPVLHEIRAGLQLLSIERPEDAVAWLHQSRADTVRVLDNNYRTARARYSVEDLPERIGAAFTAVGWASW